MKKVVFLFLLSILSFGQNKKIDSLRNALKKEPDNFNLQVDILAELIDLDDTRFFENELKPAQIRFKNNKDEYNYFKISNVTLLLKNKKDSEAKKVLKTFDKNLDLVNLPKTNIQFNYLNAFMESNLGNHQIAKKYCQEAIKLINENKLEKKRFAHVYNQYSSSLIKLGEYEKALEMLFKIVEIKDYKHRASVYSNIGICYFYLKQLKKAEYFYQLGINYAIDSEKANNISNLAILFLENGDFAKAEKTLSQVDFKKLSTTDSAAIFSVRAEIEKQKKNYQKAIEYFKIVEKIDLKNQQNSYVINDYLALGILYKESRNYDQAESYLKKSYQLLKNYKDENAKMEVLETLLSIDFLKNKNPVAGKYFDEFLAVSDSLNSRTVQESTNALNIKYQTAENETKIKSQQLELQKEKTNKYLAFGGIGLLFLLFASGSWFFRNKQKQKELQTQNTLLSLQQNLNSMELHNLNQQLDPHEIKNLLASISPEIQEKAPESYKKMLKLFNITKASLNNHSITDSIENQMQQIEDLLSLEKNTLVEPLEYNLENRIKNTTIEIPRLMLKNLVENAVKHGIKGNENGGKINIILEERGNFIYISVDDTGKGRTQAILSDSRIGTTTYQKLFATLNKKNKESATFEIVDKEQGTKVEVTIPKDYKYN